MSAIEGLSLSPDEKLGMGALGDGWVDWMGLATALSELCLAFATAVSRLKGVLGAPMRADGHRELSLAPAAGHPDQ